MARAACSPPSPAAVARVAAFAAAAGPDGAARLGAAAALVRATFPEADLGAVSYRGGQVGTGTRAAHAIPVRAEADAGVAPDAARGGEAARPGLAIFPTPTAGAATVRLVTADAAAAARITVVDALGRRVALLHDGALGAGTHTFRLGRLAPGVYVVRGSAGIEPWSARLVVVR